MTCSLGGSALRATITPSEKGTSTSPSPYSPHPVRVKVCVTFDTPCKLYKSLTGLVVISQVYVITFFKPFSQILGPKLAGSLLVRSLP